MKNDIIFKRSKIHCEKRRSKEQSGIKIAINSSTVWNVRYGNTAETRNVDVTAKLRHMPLRTEGFAHSLKKYTK